MGRSREFDVDEALDAALRVFWRKGYEGASYTDLTHATGVERPALYAAFGNKEALFRRALRRYLEHYVDYAPAALKQPTARQVAEHFLRGSADLATRYPRHTGCFGVNGVLAGSDDAERVRRALIEARANREKALRERFERARQEGDLPKAANPAVLAAYVTTVLEGNAVRAKAGATRTELDAIIDQALSTWPTSKGSGTEST